MRVTTAPDEYKPRDDDYSRTLRRRVALKWLPIYCQNDLVHGSWYAESSNLPSCHHRNDNATLSVLLLFFLS
jgi:hypothetical protein